jgi:hypothetical protein
MGLFREAGPSAPKIDPGQSFDDLPHLAAILICAFTLSRKARMSATSRAAEGKQGLSEFKWPRSELRVLLAGLMEKGGKGGGNIDSQPGEIRQARGEYLPEEFPLRLRTEGREARKGCPQRDTGCIDVELWTYDLLQQVFCRKIHQLSEESGRLGCDS